jgi:aminoglycoside phosphotransferase (APT) family kinase protein
VAERGPDVAELLAAWMRSHGGDARVEVTGRAAVGLSQETWFVRVDEGEGPVDAVLRLPTPASGPQAILTQAAALHAVTGRVPAPAVLWHDDGADNPFGGPFLVMERIGGTVPVGWHDVPEPARGTLAEQAVDVMAALHAVEAGRLGHRPAEARPTDLAFYQRRLERFAPLPAVLSGALWWLERHARRAPTPALVHGDFRMGNMMVDGDRLAGVLDWEMAAPGDPLADLAWCFIPLWEPPGVDEEALVRRYGERVGAAVDEERLHWHRVLGFVRLAYYALSGTRAFDRGHSHDLRLAALRLQLPVHLDRLAATLAREPITN